MAELKHQIEWLSERNVRSALAAEARVRVAVRRLSRFPMLGREGRIEGTRELSVPRTRFIIAYGIKGDVVEIAALRHSAQLWPTEL